MKRIIFYLVLAFFTLAIYSCGSSIPQHCPSYSSSYHKIKLKKTRGINKNVLANGVKQTKSKSWR